MPIILQKNNIVKKEYTQQTISPAADWCFNRFRNAANKGTSINCFVLNLFIETDIGQGILHPFLPLKILAAGLRRCLTLNAAAAVCPSFPLIL
jgi:hypothetical protein